jgi:hypothetical protein
VRVADLWGGEACASLRKLGMFGAEKDGPNEATLMFGMKLDDMERLSVFQRDPDTAPLYLVTSRQPLQREAVRKSRSFGHPKPERKLAGKPFFLREATWSGLVILDDHTFAAGPVALLEELVQRSAPASQGRLSPALKEAPDSQLVVGISPAVAIRDVKKLPDLPGLDRRFSLRSLLAAREAFLRIRAGADLDARLTLVFHQPEDAQAAAPVAEGMRLWTLGQLHELLDSFEDAKDVRGGPEQAAVIKTLTTFLKAGQAALKKTRCVSAGNRLDADLRVPARGAAEAAFMLVQMAPGTIVEYPPRPRGPEPAEMARLEQLAKALQQYQEKHGHFPPAAVHAKDGTALLSWRVLLLPYLGEEKLFQQFKLDEPWDGPHNRKLIGKMPKVFRGADAEGPTTCYQAFVGPGAAFEGKTGLRRTDFKDDPARTILIAEATVAVPWTKPEDLVYTPKGALLNCGHYGRMQAAFLDGKVRVVKGESQMPVRPFLNGLDDPDELEMRLSRVCFQDKVLRGLITRSGGEPAPAILPAAGPGPEMIDGQPRSGQPAAGLPAGVYQGALPTEAPGARTLTPQWLYPTSPGVGPSTGTTRPR